MSAPQRVLVTGAGRGIGAAVAGRFAADGAHVVVSDRDAAAAGRVAADLVARGASAEPAQLDVGDPAAVLAARSRWAEPFDVVVANAGVQGFAPASELDPADWDRTLRVNARGTLLTLQLAAAVLVDGGAAVVVASVQAHLPNPLSADYAASKAAALSLVRTFAAELAPRGIRVNAVAPGRIDTDLSDDAGRRVGELTGRSAQEVLADRVATNPFRRTGTPAEVAAVVRFLASAEASYVTGESVAVCGGDVMTP